MLIFKKAYVFLLLFCVFSLEAKSQKTNHQVFQLAWWNVENLFDITNDPSTNDDAFTPKGKNQWHQKRLSQKFKNLSRVIFDLKKTHPTGQLPEIFGFCEVEHASLLEELFQKHLLASGYKFAYKESSDRRGIDVGFAYNANVFSLIHLQLIPFQILDQPGREILFALFETQNHQIAVYGNHWPSRRNNPKRSERLRIAAAQALKHHVDSLMHENPSLDIIIMGDFNDEPHNASISKTLKATPLNDSNKVNLPGQLFNCMDAPSPIGSYIFHSKWHKFDQILVAQTLLDGRGFNLAPHSFKVFYMPYMFKLMKGGRALELNKTYSGNNYLGGISDHLPIYVLIQLLPPNNLNNNIKSQ